MIIHRVLLGVLLVLGVAGCALSRFMDMVLLNLPIVYAEIDAAGTTGQRRSELVTGLTNVWGHQLATNTYLWWVGLATVVVAGIAIVLASA